MFTVKELNIMRSALVNWSGPYSKDATLTEKEKERVEKEIKIAHELAERFEALLYDRYEITRLLDVLAENAGFPVTEY